MNLRLTDGRARLVFAGGLIAVVAVVFAVWYWQETSNRELAATTRASAEQSERSQPAADRNSVELSDTQREAVKVEPVAVHDFPVQKQAVGSIDFNEDMSVQVFTPYQGRIIGLYAAVAMT